MTSLEDFAVGEAKELRAALQRTQRQLVQAKQRTAHLVEAVYQAAHDAQLALGKPEPVVPPKRDRRKKPEIALLHATDWQVGKQTPTYDSDVAAERLAAFTDKAHQLADIQRADHPVREAVLMLGGDMVEGVSIFPSQPFEVDSTLYAQTFHVVKIIETMVRSLLAGFEHVTVYDIHGNHGRIGRKGDVPALDNIDRLLYRIVYERFQGEKRLRWHHAQSWHQIVTVGNYRALLVHGDQIRSFGGNLPAYGIVKKFSAWKSGVLDPFQDVFVGHFHNHQSLSLGAGGHVFMTGSPESGNEFAREFVGATGQPSQRMHFVDPERGRTTAEYQVWL